MPAATVVAEETYGLMVSLVDYLVQLQAAAAEWTGFHDLAAIEAAQLLQLPR